jgi:hypothetical protein
VAGGKKPGVSFWATVVVVVALVAYPLSFGPACWLFKRSYISEHRFSAAYEPCVQAAESGPYFAQRVIRKWADLCAGGMLNDVLKKRADIQELRRAIRELELDRANRSGEDDQRQGTSDFGGGYTKGLSVR